jgi:hypothetical protein
MDDEIGEMHINREFSIVTRHFIRAGQFFGFPGSVGPSQVICREGFC